MRTVALTFLLAWSFVQKAETARSQPWHLQTAVPRWGFFEVAADGGVFPPVIDLLTTDTNEGLHTATAVVQFNPFFDRFGIRTGAQFGPAFGGFAEVVLPGYLFGTPTHVFPMFGTTITQTPHNLDAASWAFAIGIRNGSELKAFFQMRLAGSSATVLDSSLASQAVAAGLWSNSNDYFEFNPNHAGIAMRQLPANGPEDYYGFTIPEPVSAVPCAIAAAALVGWRRCRMVTASLARTAAP